MTAGRVTEPNAPGPFGTGRDGMGGGGVPGRAVLRARSGGTAWHRGTEDGAGREAVAAHGSGTARGN